MRQRTVGGLMTCGVVNAAPGDTFKDVVECWPTTTPLPCLLPMTATECWVSCSRRIPYGPKPPSRSRPAACGRRPLLCLRSRRTMTSPAVVARPEWSVVEAAWVLALMRLCRGVDGGVGVSEELDTRLDDSEEAA